VRAAELGQWLARLRVVDVSHLQKGMMLDVVLEPRAQQPSKRASAKS